MIFKTDNIYGTFRKNWAWSSRMFPEYPWLRGCLGVISCYIADTFKN